MERMALLRCGAMNQANRLPTPCMTGAKGDWWLARRFLTRWAAISSHPDHCKVGTRILREPIFLFLFSIFCFHGPGQHFDHRRRRDWMRDRQRRFETLAGRVPGRAISK